jgi:hypothetical protein
MSKLLTVELDKLVRKLAADLHIDSYTVNYMLQRFRAEGIKFLTVTLPKLAKAVLKGIEAGHWGHRDRSLDNRPTDFAWKGRSLRFFPSLLNKIFCRKTGVLLKNPSPSALYALRQMCDYLYKLALAFDERTLERYEEKFSATQKDLSAFQFDPAWLERLRKNAETYYPVLFKAHVDDILRFGPRFGPGSVAFGDIRTNLPYYLWKSQSDRRIGTCLSAFAPYWGYFKPYKGVRSRHYKPRFVNPKVLRSEVLFVPKDSRGPRVISKEPPHAIKAQMAFFGWMSSSLEGIANFPGRINFVDQTVNQELARESSLTRKMVTADMRDASDRVMFDLVKHIARNAPGIRYMLRACRSSETLLPSGKTIRLHSLAGMGSGFTFPILAFVIHLSVCTRISLEHGLPFLKVARDVYVYGDDLIVPTGWATSAYRGLELSGLLVNRDKSYVHSHFRESCGADYFYGVSVAPVRLRLGNSAPYVDGTQLKFENRSNAIVSLVAHTHELRNAGLNSSAEYLESVLEKHIPMPYVREGSGVLGRLTSSDVDVYNNPGIDRGGVKFMRACTYVASTKSFDEACPLKFLSASLRSLESSDALPPLGRYWRLLDPYHLAFARASQRMVSGQVFGEIPIPRRIRLKLGEVEVIRATSARLLP